MQGTFARKETLFFNPIQDGSKKAPTSTSPATSTNVRISL